MEAITPCKIVGRDGIHRPRSGLSASPSCAPRRSCANLSGTHRSSEVSSHFLDSTVLEVVEARAAQSPSPFGSWRLLRRRPDIQNRALQRRSKILLKSRSGIIGLTLGGWRHRTWHATAAKFQEFDDLPTATNDVPSGQCEAFDVGKAWNPRQARRFVARRETIEGGDSHQTCTPSTTGTAFIAAISAQTYRPPVQIPERSQVSSFITGGILLSIGAWILWVITKSEQYARKALVSPEETLVTPPPAPDMVEQYERAKASVTQAALVNEALAAVRTNDLIKCTVEMELALEENRLARTSIESDFFDEGELLQVYRGVLKVWLDGYPLDYGKILQLRGLLDIPSKEAEELEQEVQLQSDAYVI
ncbi:hypothetical protein MPTK1_2g13670 [Marchantia polymorpha subsp. ruderalis]|nr:hypothetical protein MARPO_0026s0004 [Marchantia polymorpha]BBN02218.1 hypothetical protein Mp_2g13670 [Marchantia polymorpha subsp. ruderalis]|eukprot:PTQ43100.1 hypothetical protein MARPO_0026s0004 [Marchantia polymorpha]